MLERTLPGRTVDRADLPYGLLAPEGDVAETLPLVPLLVEGKLHLGDSAVRGESLQSVAVGQTVFKSVFKSDEDRSRRVRATTGLPVSARIEFTRLFHVYFLVVDEVLFLG